MQNLIQARLDETYGLDIGDCSAYRQQWPAVKFLTHDVDAQSLHFEADSMSLILRKNVFEHVFDAFGPCS